MQEKYHFIGIGGIGMSGLAQLMLHKQHTVSGSDIAITPMIEELIKSGATVYKGQAAHHITADQIVVFSSDISTDNPEYVAALQNKCRLLHRSDLLAQLIAEKKSLAIAGTHGKTTSSALLATVLVQAGCDPSFAIGGILPQFKSNFRAGKGEFFAFEADESDQTFLKYCPLGALITNIDQDHLVNYQGNFQKLVDAFQLFINQVQSPQHLFWCGDNQYLRRLDLPGGSYGTGTDCQWRLANVRQTGFTSLFDLHTPHKTFFDIELALVGMHNALNACGVFALAFSLGVTENSIRQAFQNFKGVLRRCEKKGQFNEILFLDDYAHHPTEIETTLKGIKRAIGDRRLVAVFQPHRYSRTQECQGLFGECFTAADEVLVTDIYAAGEAPIPSITAEKVMQEIKQQMQCCQYVPRSALSHKLSQSVQTNDVIVTLGAGDVTKVGTETLILLENLLR